MKLVISGKAHATRNDDRGYDTEEPITDPTKLEKLDGAKGGPTMAFVLTEPAPFDEGNISLEFTQENALRVVCTFDTPRALDEQELHQLIEDVSEELWDGAGREFRQSEVVPKGVALHLTDGDLRAELFDDKGESVDAFGGNVPTQALGDEESGLLTSVYNDIDDDEPRRLYAEWLRGKDDARAEFIELQLKLAGPKPLKKDEKRANALLLRHWREWTGPLADFLRINDSSFERGFLIGAALTADVVGDPRWSEIVDHPSLATVEVLRCYFSDEAGVRFLLSTPLKNVREMHMGAGTLKAVAGKSVAWRPTFLALRGAAPDRATLDLVEGDAAFDELTDVSIVLAPAPADMAAYKKIVLEHPLTARVEGFSISIPTLRDPDYVSKVVAWLTPELRPGGSLAALGVEAKNYYILRLSETGWTELEVQLADAGVGEFFQMAGKFPRGRIRSLRVVGTQTVPDFHRTLVKGAEALGPLDHVELPPPPPGA